MFLCAPNIQATYEATLLAGVINAHSTGNRQVFLTFVGNRISWIVDAINLAVQKLAGAGIGGIDVCVLHHQCVNDALLRAIAGVDAPVPMVIGDDWACPQCSIFWSTFADSFKFWG